MDIESKLKGESTGIRVRSYMAAIHQSKQITLFQIESHVGSLAASRPKRSARTKPVSMADLHSEDSKDSDLDDDDLKAIAEAKL